MLLVLSCTGIVGGSIGIIAGLGSGAPIGIIDGPSSSSHT